MAIETIVESKFEVVSELLLQGRFGLMWLVAILISMSLAAASAYIVVYGEPAAGGSGIPDIMAYLNGVSIRRVRPLVGPGQTGGVRLVGERCPGLRGEGRGCSASVRGDDDS